ncbi:MAG: hypothetical protein AB1588_07820 [Pseudomonadota bacterium]
MKIKLEHDGEFIPPAVLHKSVEIVSSCLQEIVTCESGFIINDTIHYRRQRNNKVTPCVMNSANFISRRFQSNLSKIEGCQGETKLIEQDIDGIITCQYSGAGYKIRDKNRLLEVLHNYIESRGLPPDSVFTLFPMFYGMYVQSDIYDIAHLPPNDQALFEQIFVDKTFKLGVEFETGNVASSFRAINKLFILFQAGLIDAGVFITSIDKTSSATRIWPVSNRNGSFQELRQRNFMKQVSLPLICIGFAPDGFDTSAPFLGRTGSLYYLRNTGRDSPPFEVYTGEDGEEILRPAGVSLT